MKNRKAVGVQTYLTLPKGMGEQCRLLQDGVIKGKHGSYNKQAAKRCSAMATIRRVCVSYTLGLTLRN